MLIQKVKILTYDKDTNTCTASNQYGEIFDIDPFVGCAIEMTDSEYESGKGFEIIGKSYAMTIYSVYESTVVPHRGGFSIIGNHK